MRLPLKYDRLIDCVLNQHIVKIAFHSRRHLEYDRLRRLTPVRQVDQGLHHLLDAFILEACRPLAYDQQYQYTWSIAGQDYGNGVYTATANTVWGRGGGDRVPRQQV